MEFKARYELIGAFSLAVIAALFGFVYWLNNAGGQGEQISYRVRFESPVSGLQIGGGVFFNGLHVGEVTNLDLDPQNPNRLNATISIKEGTPVRTDTVVGIDHQGLTGIAGISLTGGSSTAVALTSSDQRPPLLVARTKAGNNWTQTANQVLAQFDEILGENKQPFKDILANLSTFSKVLSGDQKRLDNILDGLERMTGGSGKKSAGIIYDLIAPNNFSPIAEKPGWRLVIAEPTVMLALNTDKIQQREESGETKPLDGARWADNLPNLFQEKIIQSFENAGYLSAVLRPIEGEETDNKLLINIRGFHLSTKGKATAQIEFTAKLMNGGGKVIAARSFKSAVPALKSDATNASTALGAAFSKSAVDLIAWTAGSI